MKHNWEYKPIGDCFAYIKNGANIKQEKGCRGLPITRIETLSNGVFNRSKMGYANIFEIDKYKQYVLNNCDLLMSHINSKTYVGRTVMYEALPNEVIIHGMNLLRLIPYDTMRSKFFYYITLSNYFKSKIVNIRKDSVNQSSFAISDLKKISIPVPPMVVQEQIVEELDAINGLIEKNREVLRNLDALAQSLFYHTFGDPISNPKGYKISLLEQCVTPNCPISYGIVQPGDDFENGIPVVRPVDFINHRFVRVDNLKRVNPIISEPYKRTLLNGDEILMCVRGTTGMIRLADKSLNGANVTRGIVPIQVREDYSKTYIYEYLKSEKAQSYIAYFTKGTTLKQINIADLRKLPVLIPPLALQEDFAAKIEAIEAQKAKVETAIAQLQTLLDSRMDYWFN